MYYITGWPSLLSVHNNELILSISSDSSSKVILILYKSGFQLYLVKPSLLLIESSLNASDIQKYGYYYSALILTHVKRLILSTENGFIHIYSLNIPLGDEVDHEHDPSTVSYWHDNPPAIATDLPTSVTYATGTPSLFLSQEGFQLPSVTLKLLSVVKFDSCISCLSELAATFLLVGTIDGCLHRIRLSDSRKVKDATLQVDSIPFFHNLGHSSPAYLQKASTSNAHPIANHNSQPVPHIVKCSFSPLLCALVVLFSNGQGALVFCSSFEERVPSSPTSSSGSRFVLENCSEDELFLPGRVAGLWPENLRHASSISLNERCRLLAFGIGRVAPLAASSSSYAMRAGTSSSFNPALNAFPSALVPGECVVYSFDEDSGSLMLSHRLLPTHFPTLPLDIASSSFAVNGVTRNSSTVQQLGVNHSLCTSGTPAVVDLKWSPDSSALAVIYERGGFALWSTFGAQLLNSFDHLQSRTSGSPQLLLEMLDRYPLARCSALEWCRDGYRLFLVANQTCSAPTAASSQTCSRLYALSIAKSAYHVNPASQAINRHLVLHTDEQILMHLHSFPAPSSASILGGGGGGVPFFGSEPFDPNRLESRALSVLQVPSLYLRVAEQIHAVTLSSDAQHLAVAGLRGLCTHSLADRRWRLFASDTQERDFRVFPNGLVFYRDEFAVCNCFCWSSERHELRFYSMHEKLDNRHAFIFRASAAESSPASAQESILQVYADSLLLLFSRSRASFSIFLIEDNVPPGAKPRASPAPIAEAACRMETNTSKVGLGRPSLGKGHERKLDLLRLQEVSLDGHIPFPPAVLSVKLSTLHSERLDETCYRGSPDSSDTKTLALASVRSLLVNYGGTMLLFQCDANPANSASQSTWSASSRVPQAQVLPSTTITSSTAALKGRRALSFTAPKVLANHVERVWLDAGSADRSPTLWLNCGQEGLKVWLPLRVPGPGYPLQSSPPSSPQPLLHEILEMSSVGAASASAFRDRRVSQCDVPLLSPGPLSSDGRKHHSSFLSKRVMLAFQPNASDLYALGSFAERAQLIGVQLESLCWLDTPAGSASNELSDDADADAKQTNNRAPLLAYQHLPCVTPLRAHECYLPHVLKQLLRMNLGVYALSYALQHQQARTARYSLAGAAETPDLLPAPAPADRVLELSLELLIHEIVEEEATTRLPVPDPLLPRAIEFLREFQSFFYKILAHVLRKTEYHLWDYVIKAAGPGCSIKELFEQCLFVEELEDHLDVAASYFLILQQRESLEASRQHALLLLDRALAAEKWELARDLIRFLSCIAPEELDSSHDSSFPSPLSSFAQSHLAASLSLKSATANANAPGASQADPKSAAAVARMRHQTVPIAANNSASGSKPPPPPAESVPPHSPDAIAIALGAPSLTAQLASCISQPMILIEQLLHKFARNLLRHYRLRKLGYFAAHIPQFSLAEFLRRESRRESSKLENMVAALEALHEEFDWPYPSSNQNDCASDSTSGIVAPPQASPVVLSKLQQQLRPLAAGALLGVAPPALENRLPGSNSLPSPSTLQSIPSAAILPTQGADAGGQRVVNVCLQPTGESGSGHAGNHRSRNYSTALESSEQHGGVSRTRRSSETSSITNGSSVYNLLMPAAPRTNLSPLSASLAAARDSLSLASKAAATLDSIALPPSARDPRFVQRERQLRHMYRQLLDAECFEYALLVCVLLRDNLCLFELIDRLQALLQSAAVAPASVNASVTPTTSQPQAAPEANSAQQSCAQPGLVVQTHSSSLSNSGEYLGTLSLSASSLRPLTRPELVQVLRRLFAGLQQLHSWAASAACGTGATGVVAKFENREYAKFFGGLLEHMRVHFLWAFGASPKKQTALAPAISAPLSVDAAHAAALNQSSGCAQMAPRTLVPSQNAFGSPEASAAAKSARLQAVAASLTSTSAATLERQCAPATGSNSDTSTTVSSASRSSSLDGREPAANHQHQQLQLQQALLGAGGCSQQQQVHPNPRAMPGKARPGVAAPFRIEHRTSVSTADEPFHVVSNAEPPPNPDAQSRCTIS